MSVSSEVLVIPKAPLDFRIHHPADASGDPRAQVLAEACSYQPSDRAVFLAGYAELCRVDPNGAVALEICSGLGALASQVARVFPEARVTALDLYVPDPDKAGWGARVPNLGFRAGTASDLSFLPF